MLGELYLLLDYKKRLPLLNNKQGGAMKSNTFRLLITLCVFEVLWAACSYFIELQGTWIGYEESQPLIDWELIIEGNQFKLIREDDGIWYKGRLKLNNNCVLKKIDFEIKETHIATHAVKTLLGIYAIENDSLTIASNESEARARPEAFDEPANSHVFYFVRTGHDSTQRVRR